MADREHKTRGWYVVNVRVDVVFEGQEVCVAASDDRLLDNQTRNENKGLENEPFCFLTTQR